MNIKLQQKMNNRNNPKQPKSAGVTVENTNRKTLVAHALVREGHKWPRRGQMATQRKAERSEKAGDGGGEAHQWRGEIEDGKSGLEKLIYGLQNLPKCKSQPGERGWLDSEVDDRTKGSVTVNNEMIQLCRWFKKKLKNTRMKQRGDGSWDEKYLPLSNRNRQWKASTVTVLLDTARALHS
jgi:hypothetical protein